MNQETMFALARISELKRAISHPMLHHRYVADQRRIAAGRPSGEQRSTTWAEQFE